MYRTKAPPSSPLKDCGQTHHRRVADDLLSDRRDLLGREESCVRSEHGLIRLKRGLLHCGGDHEGGKPGVIANDCHVVPPFHEVLHWRLALSSVIKLDSKSLRLLLFLRNKSVACAANKAGFGQHLNDNFNGNLVLKMNLKALHVQL